jgi:hypothetical protein
MKFVACWSCEHYNQRSYKVATGQKNVSGGIVWRRVWAKHRCNLKQEHLYPRYCDYKPDSEAVIRAKKFNKEAEALVV